MKTQLIATKKHWLLP